MVRTISVSETRLLSDPRPLPPRGGVAALPQRSGGPTLSHRALGTEDLPWVQSWTAQLNLPTPRTTRVRSFILLEDDRRVGYLAARPTAFNTGQGREPVMWIVGAYLVPSRRGRRLLPRFCELLSRAHYPSGKAAARVAAENATMHRFMATGGWRKVRTTTRYTDYVLELTQPYRAMRRR